MSPLFSVVIPLFNKEKVIAQTLASVLSQSYRDFEIVIVDDGSTDASRKEAVAVKDERIKLFAQENAGPGAARNRGVREATGEWILFLDADDIQKEGALDSFASAISDYPDADLIGADFHLAEKGKKGKSPFHYRDGKVRNPFKAWFFKRLHPCTGTFICKREVLLKHPYDESLRLAEDCDMLFRIFDNNAVYSIKTPVMEYRREFSQASKVKFDISRDFLGHLRFDGSLPFWKRICMYEFYVEAKNLYPHEYRSLYPDVEKDFFLKGSYTLLFWLRALERRIGIL